jgi:hypothetical protein
VNGSRNGTPLANVEVVLRAGAEGSLQIVAQTKTDGAGRFAFDRLPAGTGPIFVAGVNHHGIHYPGAKVRLPHGSAPPAMTLTAFDAIAAPSPLIAERHEIDIEIQKGALQVTETLWVDNPSSTTYVGEDQIGALPTTLSLSIPDGFERVTFHSEFDGRHFKLRDNQLFTDLPWTPGKRAIRFSYVLPIEDGKHQLEWSMNVPCKRRRLGISGENADRVGCNLPRVAGPNVAFESSEQAAAGYAVTLELGSLPTPWIAYLRWSAVAILAGLVAVTAGCRMRRRSRLTSTPHTDGHLQASKAA